MKNKFTLLLLLFSGITQVQLSNAQGTDNYGAGLRINLDTTGKKYVRMLT